MYVCWFQQEDIEETARGALWREELIEEIEQKVGGLRELEEAGKKEEELVRQPCTYYIYMRTDQVLSLF